MHLARTFLNSAMILTGAILLSACSTTSTKVTNIRMSTNVVMVTQLYDPTDEKNVWAIQINSSDRESTANIIESAAAAIVKHLKRDKLVGPG